LVKFTIFSIVWFKNIFQLWNVKQDFSLQCFIYELLFMYRNLVLAHLFVKATRLGESEMTFLVFASSCHLFLPV